ncbi:histone-like nucleoid-structuring protein Lsr2 [Streptacidiphilus albus]|uniref:histone-like nucleoid-structuring protein Lsr2 n=1 Tax=Streptacidiphilus albus TaxID=105425 RepID=UPI00054C5A57|nr:Lsr2 family protein [Streptacidiphilus albus]
MAQKVVVELLDDLDGSEAVETIVFALNGQSYEIDLGEKNAGKFRKALAPFVEAGRKQGGAKRGKTRVSVRSGGQPNPVVVRAWASSQGIEVAARGRVPAEVITKYQAAH